LEVRVPIKVVETLQRIQKRLLFVRRDDRRVSRQVIEGYDQLDLLGRQLRENLRLGFGRGQVNLEIRVL
jgi:hypothetical protein